MSEFSKIKNVFIAANSERAINELSIALECPVLLLPNYYPVKDNVEHLTITPDNEINIGCFGAIRPMKNQLLQAIAAIKFSKSINKKLRFHININREETGGNNVIKNLRALFENSEAELVEHPWADHHHFIKILNGVDIGMQVSLSETYNIVTADMVNKLIPVVVSKEIRWVMDNFKVNPTSFEDIVSKLNFCYMNLNGRLVKKNKQALADNSKKAIFIWEENLKSL